MAFTQIKTNLIANSAITQEKIDPLVELGGGSSVTTSNTAPVSPSSGDMWYNTTNGKLFVYYNSNWVEGQSTNQGIGSRVVDVYTASANQVTFTTSSGYTVGYVDVYINGIKILPADFTATNATTVILEEVSDANDEVVIISWTLQPGVASFTSDIFTANGAQTAFTLSTTPSSKNQTSVVIDGVTQVRDTYSVNGSLLTFSETPLSNSVIEVTTARSVANLISYNDLADKPDLSNISAGVKISNIQVTNSGGTVLDDTAVDTAGGYILLTGSGFASGCQVIINNVPATSTTFVNSTTVRAQLPATAAGTYIVYLINSDGGVGIRVNGVTFSASPGWQTSSSLSGNVDDAISIQLIATEATVFALQAGSTLPTGLTLSSGGLISGTVTGLVEETIYSFTVVATDAQNQESPRTFSITITVGDAYFNRTVLAINADVGNTFASDASSNNFAITVAGDTRPFSFSPYNTNWSNYFDGSGDCLQTTALNISSGNFTIEAWVNLTTMPTTDSWPGSYSNWMVIVGVGSANLGDGWQFRIGQTTLAFGTNSDTTAVSGTHGITAGSWNHLACVRNGNVYTLYVNGVSVATATYTANQPGTGAFTWVGSETNQGAYLNGYISNLRILAGTSFYTTNFTPPTSPLTAITNTSLLTCQSNRLIDNSTNAFTITKNGDVKVSASGPFTETDTTTGSGYFDGAGDYLTVADSATLEPGSSNFTIECWIYPTATGSFLGVFSKRTNNATDYSPIQILINSGTMTLFASTTGSSWAVNVNASTSPPLNAWSHIAVVRNGTASNNLVLYLNGVSVATGSVSNTALVNNSGAWAIAADSDDGGGNFAGYISGFRYVLGSAVYTATFTPPTAPLTAVANTQILTLQTRQPVNNHSFIDASRNNLLVTKVGNASQGSFSPFSPGGWSNYFDGTGDYLNVSYLSSNFGTGDFTVEVYVYLTRYDVDGNNIIDTRSAAAANPFVFGIITTGAYYYNGTTYSSSTVVPLNTWVHLAICRSGTTIKIFQNGIETLSRTDGSNLTGTSTGSITIGRAVQGVAHLNGYLSNLRIVKGTAVYTTNFTPPTSELTAIANTSLLMCQSNRFIDNSTNNFTITKNGDAAVVNFSPFKPTANYSRTTHGGSVYFDGSGDSVDLTLADSNIAIVGNRVGTTQFVWTIEAWVYPLSNIFTIIQRASNSVGDLEWYWYQDSTNGLTWHHRQYGSNDRFAYANIVLKQKQWHHIVQQKEDNSAWVFYVNGVKCNTTYGAGGSPNAYGDVNLVNGNLTKIGASTTGPAGAFYMSDFMFTRNIRYSGNNITLPTSPTTANSYTSLLLNYNNAGIVDVSSRNVLETVGGAGITTLTKKYGTGSMYFDGVDDNVVIPYDEKFSLGTTDFTVEGWFNFANINTNYRMLVLLGDGANGGSVYHGWSLGYLGSEGSNQIIFKRYDGTDYSYTTTGVTISANTWYHIAVSRYNSVLKIFVDGVSYHSSNVTTSFNAVNTNPLRIGLGYLGPAAGYGGPRYWNGYIDDLRITRGVARYTANFTPPTGTFLVR